MNAIAIVLFSFTFCVINAQVQIINGPNQSNSTSTVNNNTGAVNPPKCAENGEYCQTPSDCCSGGCLSFTYKCVPLHKPVQSEAQKPPTQEEIVSRFGEENSTNCANINDYCQLNSDCCSKNCLSFSYKCVANHGLDLIFQQYPQGQPLQSRNESSITNVDDLITRFGTQDDSPKEKDDKSVEKPVVKEEQEPPVCKKRNEQCTTNENCCNNMKCHRNKHVCYQRTRSLSSRFQDNGAYVSY